MGVAQEDTRLPRHLPGHVIVLLDHSRTHKGDPLRPLRRRHPRLHIEHFPSYAPEINPDEGVWHLAKNALANGRPDDVSALASHLHGSLRRLRRSQRALRGCILQSDLPSFLP